jgi:two-component system nitrate/nitrite sensor histidine kinase NarX
MMTAVPWIYWLALPAAALCAGAVVFWMMRRSAARTLALETRRVAERLTTLQAQVDQYQNRLDAVMNLNRDLVEAADENALVSAALTTVNRLVGGLGSTYVPFDAWGQPMPAFTYGEMPEPVMKGWAEHLASEHVRERCHDCTALHAPQGYSCPLQFGPLGGTMNIYCVPLALGDRRLGMVNIYLRAGQSLSPDMRQFLNAVMDEMALAVEAMRLRIQEVVTLRQLSHLRSPRMGLTNLLETLLENLLAPVKLDALSLRVRPMSDERLSHLDVNVGDRRLDVLGRLGESWIKLLDQDSDWVERVDDGLAWTALPLRLPEGQVLGVLAAVRCSGSRFTPNQKSVLETAAAQAAMMIENDRQNMSMEYTLVIQERTRLAREIHDGLAQMLAFLKMQAAQMQTAMTQGDQPRLARLLQESRQAISEAYLETRQAIDNLRVRSDDGLLAWLAQTAVDFERAAHVRVVTALPESEPGLLPEIQAQMIRITQEALNNVRKHARANEVRISLRRLEPADTRSERSDWILEVVDDGCGFEPEDVPVVARYGLRGMRERAELIGAEFQIASQPGRGTLVRLYLPGQVEEVGE